MANLPSKYIIFEPLRLSIEEFIFIEFNLLSLQMAVPSLGNWGLPYLITKVLPISLNNWVYLLTIYSCLFLIVACVCSWVLNGYSLSNALVVSDNENVPSTNLPSLNVITRLSKVVPKKEIWGMFIYGKLYSNWGNFFFNMSIAT